MFVSIACLFWIADGWIDWVSRLITNSHKIDCNKIKNTNQNKQQKPAHKINEQTKNKQASQNNIKELATSHQTTKMHEWKRKNLTKQKG